MNFKKKIKYFFYISLFITYLSCDSKTESLIGKASQINIKNVDLILKKDIQDIITNLNYLTLQQIPDIDAIHTFDKVIEYKEKYYVLDKKKSNILVFNNNGVFLSKIGKRGGGPGEYQSIFDFDIDTKNGQILLLDNQTELLFYNTKNEFLKSFKFKKFFPESISLLNSKEIACGVGHIEPGGHGLKIISSENGEVIKNLAKYPDDYNDYKSYAFTGGIKKSVDNSYYIYKSSSLIYKVNQNNSLSPSYQFNFGKKTWPEDEIFNLEEFDAETHRFNVSLLNNNFFIDENIIMFKYLDLKKIKEGCYFKKEKKLFIPEKSNADILRFFSIPLGKRTNNSLISGISYEKYQLYKEKGSDFTKKLQLISNKFAYALEKMNYDNSSMLIFYNLKVKTNK